MKEHKFLVLNAKNVKHQLGDFWENQNQNKVWPTFFSIAILRWVDNIFFSLINSDVYLKYAKFHKDFKNWLTFKFEQGLPSKTLFI